MLQKIKDGLLLLQGSRAAQFVLGLVIFSILFLNFYDRPRKTKWVKPPKRVIEEDFAREEDSDIVFREFRDEVDKIKVQAKRLTMEQRENTEQITQFEGEVTTIFKKMLNRLDTFEDKMEEAIDKVVVDRAATGTRASESRKELAKARMEPKGRKLPPKKSSQKKKSGLKAF